MCNKNNNKNANDKKAKQGNNEVMSLLADCSSKYLRGLLGKYQRAQSPLSTFRLRSEHCLICSLSTPFWHISCERKAKSRSSLHEYSSKMNAVFGHSSTHTWGVLHPNNGTRASIHFSKLKNSKYGLFITSLSTPHLRPFESVGTSNRSKSPFFMATNVRKKKTISTFYFAFLFGQLHENSLFTCQ